MGYWFDNENGFGYLMQFQRGNPKESKLFCLDGEVRTKEKYDGTTALSDFISYYSGIPSFPALNNSPYASEDKLYESCEFITYIEDSFASTLSVELKMEKDDGKKTEAKTKSGRNKSYVVTVREGDVKCSCNNSYRYYTRSYYSLNRYCKHEYLVSRYLSDKLYEINSEYVHSKNPAVDKGLMLDFAIIGKKNELRDFKGDLMAKMDAVKEIIRMLWEPESDDYAKLFFTDLMKDGSEYYSAEFMFRYKELLIAALDHKRTRDFLDSTNLLTDTTYYDRQTKSNRAYFRKLLKAYDKAIKDMEKGIYDDSFSSFEEKGVILRLREDWKGLLKYYAEPSFSLYEKEFKFLHKMKENIVLEESDHELLVEVLLKVDESYADSVLKKNLFFSLVPLLPESEKIRLFSRIKVIKIDVDTLKSLNMENQKMLASNTDPTAGALDYIWNTVFSGASAEEKGRYLLMTLGALRNQRPDRERIEQFTGYASSLPDSRLLFYYIDRTLNGNGRNKFPGKAGKIEDEINRYFITQFKIMEGKTLPEVEYYVMHPVLNVCIIEVKEKEGVFTLHADNRIEDSLDPQEIKAICIKGREKKYKEKIREAEEKIATTIFTKNNKDFANAMEKLGHDLISEEKVILSEDAKANIGYSFYFNDSSAAISFKVGSSRMYQVKNALDFITAFKKRTTVEYGKDLILTHEEENLQPQDSRAIELLMAARISSGRKGDIRNKKFVTIDLALMANLLEILKGRKVYFNDKETMVNLSKLYFRTGVDGNYMLTTTLKENQLPMILGNKGYVFTDEAKGLSSIDMVSNSVDEMKILLFFNSYRNISIKPIIHDFKKKIFAHHSEFIDIEPEARKDFVLSQIQISAYFDYERGAINMKTKIEKDGEEADLSRLERHDKDKLDSFNSYIRFLGFDDKGRMDDDAHVLSFFRMDFARLRSHCTVYLSENLTNKQMTSLSRQVFRISYNSGIMDIFLEKSDFTESELSEILKGLRQKKKYIILKGNRIVDLDTPEAKDFQEAVDDFGVDEGNLYQKKQISMSTAIKAFAHQRNCHVDKYLRDMIQDLRNFKTADIALPKLNAKLRSYQTEGYNWLSILSSYNLGGILADDMGLGKTIQMIALMKADKRKMPSLVVCPKSLVFNWKSEILRFDGKTECVEVYGPESARSKIIESIDYNKKAIYITSYESFRSDAKKYSGQFLYAILDEAQFIKNVYAQKTRSVKEINAVHRFALTGTPIENSVVDLWSIFDFIMPGYLEDLNLFKNSDHEAIRRKVAPFILRRTKEDVLRDLPAKYERIVSAEMGDEQRKIYDALKKEASDALEAGSKAFDILPYLTRLRQICIDPGMYLESFHGRGSKMEMLSTLIPEMLHSGHRILVFSQFVKALEALEEVLSEARIPVYKLTGDTPAKERIALMNSFNEGNGTDVFLISLKAGGTGLNLTGADTVIHLDPWWNVAAEDQADDRTHRIGQKRNVEVIKLIAKNSIEERVVELQEIKKDIIDRVISNNDTSVTNATLEDIAFILK